jgi:NAD(P)-dependent dehydrogenase (short-subunit alcohol dehydrogenase family)
VKVLVIGGTGLIGAAVVKALVERYEVIVASRRGASKHVDITDAASIRALFKSVGPVDAVVSAAGSAKFAPLESLTDGDFSFSIGDKLMGQVNVVRAALEAGVVRDGGSVTITSGVLAHQPMHGAAAISMVNAGLEGFARGAAFEAPRGIRVNVVSPGWVSETLTAMGQDPKNGIPAADVARVYVAAIEGNATGSVLPAVRQ